MDDVKQRLAQMEATISSQPPQAPQPQAPATTGRATPDKTTTRKTAARTGTSVSQPQGDPEPWSLWQWALVGLGVLVVGTLALQLIRFVMGLLGLALFVAVAYFAYRFFTRPKS